jgi:hypothetical protein
MRRAKTPVGYAVAAIRHLIPFLEESEPSSGAGVAGISSDPGWEVSAKRLVDILIAGVRPRLRNDSITETAQTTGDPTK